MLALVQPRRDPLIRLKTLPTYVLITPARNEAKFIEFTHPQSIVGLKYRRLKRLIEGVPRITERSPLAKAAAGLLVVVGKTTRGFESLPSPPMF